MPLALAQFICSFAGSNMNVMINDISHDLNTDVEGVQVCITLFLLVMAALMIPCGKLTDRYGRKRLFQLGLLVYGVGAILSAVSPGLGVLILGNSIFEGVGTALLIPPVYILTTLLFHDIKSRARAFGLISGMGGIGAAAGPLIGGLITTGISWRAAFLFQAVIIVIILLLGRSIIDPVPPDPTRPFDIVGAVLSAAGLVVLVGGILAADQNLVLMLVLIVVGAVILAGFFAWIRRREQAGKEALLSTGLFRNRISNLALVTQNVQWQVLMGTSLVVSIYLQTVRHYNAIQTGVIFTAATVGILLSSLAAGAPGQAVPAADTDPGRVRDHHHRHHRPAGPGEGAPQRLVLRPGAVPDRHRPRCHADAVGQRGAIRFPGEPPGRNLRPVPQRVEPGLVDRRRGRGHHPGRRSR